MARPCDICDYPIKPKGVVLPNEGRAQYMGDRKAKYHADPHDCIALMRADLRSTDEFAFWLMKRIDTLERSVRRLERKKR